MSEYKDTIIDTHHAAKHSSTTLIVVVTLTILALLGGAVYMSGAADDAIEYFTVKFFAAKAKAEEKALEHAGSEQAQGFLKEQLKRNPVVGKGELNEISSGLGDESVKEFEKGGGLSFEPFKKE